MNPFNDLGQRSGGPLPVASARSLPSPDPEPAAGRVASFLQRVRLLSPSGLEASLRHSSPAGTRDVDRKSPRGFSS
jgi:hypothetical protein